jgi:glycosyltransferase involved in cell wall biosynthesis
MKTIGIFHYQVGQTDGVSLEIDKWKRVLEEMGHTVHLCAGDLGTVEGTLVEEMYHHRPDAKRLYHNTFGELRDYPNDAAYRAELLGLADVIERKVRDFVGEKGIDFLIPQNVWSVAASPAVAIALARVMRDLQLPALAHNHDFYWEQTKVALTCATAIELADKYLPPRDPLARHVVINSLAQRELAERKGIESTIVPNIFDFDALPWPCGISHIPTQTLQSRPIPQGWQPDEYNQDFRARIGLRENDVFILQATRIVQRKGIELAVDFVRALDSPERRAQLKARGLYDGRSFDDDSRIVLVLAGYARDDLTGGYLSRLKQKIERAGIDALFIEEMVGGRRQARDGQKIYSLWDTYVFADFVTYPSLWEGWGNQFLEALRARLPLMLFEYPVYQADIKDKGFRVVSLGPSASSGHGSEIQGQDDLGLVQIAPEVIEAAADQAVELLTDARLRQETVEHNFQLGRQHYSLEALRGYLAQLIKD